MATNQPIDPVQGAMPEDVASQVEQMLVERLNAQREAAGTTSDRIQSLTAENLQKSQNAQNAQPVHQGDNEGGSTSEIRKRLERFVEDFGQIVDKNPAFNIRIGLGITSTGDSFVQIIDKKSQETIKTIPTPEAIDLANKMQMFTDFFTDKYKQAGPSGLSVAIDTFST